MLTIVSNSVTVIKDHPFQSSLLAPHERITVLPGRFIETLEFKPAKDNNYRIDFEGKKKYIFLPHWTIHKQTITITLEQARAVYPNTQDVVLNRHLAYLNQSMDTYQINLSPIRVRYFLAQLGHESAGFRYMEELASGSAYEGRKDLGNLNKGDGVKYKGRGIIQLTGRHNYRNAGKALNVDLENNPQLASNEKYASLIAGWFWNSRNLNFWSDKEDFRQVTKLINGGYNGWDDRLKYLRRAEKVIN